MDFDQDLDLNLTKIRNQLQEDQVKLWISPYFSEEGGKIDSEIQKLADNYSSQLSIKSNICKECLQQLQTIALENLRDRDKYRTTGLASLKVRVPSKQGKGKIVTISLELSKNGLALREEICQKISVTLERLKVIFKGRILRDAESLELQGLKHGFQVMAVVLKEIQNDITTSESHAKLLNSTRDDVNLLSDNLHEDYLQVADQSGKTLELPPEERRALILALTFHEKGRAALKKEDFALALVMLLEAEKEFSICNSSLLKSVDNHGVLSLDIAWCYLNLQSVTQLPDAEERLRQCELSLHQSYGANLERLIALKGSAGNEGALFMRLHLLQAIVMFHQNKLEAARDLLARAEQELNNLIVDDNQLCQMIELGYETAESRLALRECKGDLNVALSIIENKKTEKKKIAEAEEEKRKTDKEKKKLGKCVNGSWIDPQSHKTLTSMGYSYEEAKWALAQTNNNINTSLNFIQEHPELVPMKKVKIDEFSLEQVVGMGFDSAMAALALKKHHGNMSKAVEELCACGGFVTHEENSDSDSDKEADGPSCSNYLQKKKQRKEAFSRVSEGISNSEEDHLDLNLVSETAFLHKYKNLLSER